jgi:Tol biopolymer transport system component
MWRARCAVVGLLLALGSSVPAASGAGSSRDTRFLVVITVGPKSLRPPRVELLDGRGRLERVIATADGAEWEARWSPDRSRLAWVDARGIAVANGDGSARRLVFRNRPGCAPQCSERFAWAPDSRRLAISVADTERHTSRLFVLTLRSRTTHELVPVPSKLDTY